VWRLARESRPLATVNNMPPHPSSTRREGVTMKMPWRRQRAGRHWAPPNRVPDNDTILHPGGRRSVDILRAVLEEPTRPLPVISPLMTHGQRWRTRRSAS
jgi:hypothetical protein